MLLVMVSCQRPAHIVVGDNNLVIYQKELRDNLKLGKYEYWVRDNTAQGWVLISDRNHFVGDTLKIISK